MNVKIIIIFLFISLTVFSQQNKKPYPRKIESEIWLNKYRALESDSQRITEIKNKIYSDTLYYNYKKNIILDNPRNPEKHICKVLFVINFEDEYFDIDLLENPKLMKIMRKINLNNIKSINILENPENVIYFGSGGLCGVIKLKCNKRLYRKIKNIL
jgi:hypothetical protein